MKRPYYGYPRRLNWPPIAGLCFGVAFGLVVWCAIGKFLFWLFA